MIKLKIPKTKHLVVFGFILLTISGVAWWDFVRNEERRVFDRMLSTMLSSSSVTKEISQKEGTQVLDQTVQITTSPENQAHSENVLQQGGRATIITESISKPEFDYVRYIDIKTEELNSKGTQFDFSSVLGQWGTSETSEENTNNAEIFEQSLLGIVPIAKLSPEKRSEILDHIHQNSTYEVDYSSVKKSKFFERPVYTYDVSVKPVSYIKLLKNFAKAMGLSSLDGVDSEQYASAAPIKFTFEVDVWSSHLNKVTYKGSDRTETFSAYGARVLVKEPTDAIGISELQSKLQLIN